MADFVVRDINGKLYVHELGPRCAAVGSGTGDRCARRVVTPDEADGTWTESVIPGFEARLKVFNVGYGSCGDIVLQLCRWHCQHDVPDEVTGGPLVQFDAARHSHLIGAGHLEEASRRPSSYREPPPRPIRGRLPAGPVALYRYWDRDDVLLYVGITTNLPYRARSHAKGSSWMDFAARSTIERFPTPFQAGPAEREAIRNEHPLFNSKHNESPEARRRLVEYLVKHDRMDLLAPAVSRG